MTKNNQSSEPDELSSVNDQTSDPNDKSYKVENLTRNKVSQLPLPKARVLKPPELTSVQGLLDEIAQERHEPLRQLFRHHYFVGVININLALIQHETKLYLLHTNRIAKQLFQQVFYMDSCKISERFLYHYFFGTNCCTSHFLGSIA